LPIINIILDDTQRINPQISGFYGSLIFTASANVLGRTAKGICLFQASKFSFVVLIKVEAVPLQQWLKHTYGARWPFETKRYGSVKESGAPTSITREGRVYHPS
jgi:hypothetical protein